MESLGETLKKLREEKGFTCEQVAEGINAKLEHIKAIEENSIHKLMAPAYAKGFIKSYCRFIDVDDIPIIERFNNEYSVSTPMAIFPKGSILQRRSRGREKKKIRILLTSVFLVAVVLFLIYFYGKFVDIDISKEPSSPVYQEISPDEVEPASSEEETSEGLSLSIKALDDVSVKVYVDDEELLIAEFFLMRGEQSVSYTGNTKVVVELDDGAAAVVMSPEKTFENLPEGKGRVVLTAEEFLWKKLDSPPLETVNTPSEKQADTLTIDVEIPDD